MGSKTEDFEKAVEPLANRDGATFEQCMLASIAISMKRIADAMQEPNAYGEIGGAAIAGAISRSLRQ